ncbi:hypothetical protein [Umezawaea beigongshangensis]|uniref:hypothetical protein n=1 Tax=Umezawaea beigongshangensis TaxID=2780383 RepID=UPI0018F122A2|nr:hypothetical protein [Umezawaea beigongshangensis]
MTTTATSTPPGIASALRRLYLVRFGFALVWAGALFATASGLGPVSAALLVLYPLFDVAAAVVDARSSRASGPAAGLHANIAISSLAGVGLAVAVTSGVPAVLRVWGVWAIVSGLVQLVVGISRRTLGGQWAMIASGGLSAVAGTTFYLQASTGGASLSTLAGYALVGGIFFLVSALRLGRATTRN